MGQIIDGKALAEKIKDDVTKKIFQMNGPRPNLAIILIGEREDSKLYVSLKEKEAKKVGIDTHTYKCPEDVSEEEIISMIECLNKDEMIDAILVQLPLPKKFDTDKIIKTIDPKKDVDRFHPENSEKLFTSCDHEEYIPPLIQVIIEMLKSIHCSIFDKQICIVANSKIFGETTARVFECLGGKTQIVYANSDNLEDFTKKSDILITAVGKPELIKAEMVKDKAIVIDIGINKVGKKVCGDVDFNNVVKKASFTTPVPGGVGPMTIAMLFRSTLALNKKHQEEGRKK